MERFWSQLREAFDNDRLLLLALALLLPEAGLRIVLAWQLSTFALFLVPPVIAVFGCAAKLPEAVPRPSNSDGPQPVREPWRYVGRLFAIAVVGHAFALVLGTSLFFAVDTPLRALLYWRGVDLLRSTLLALGWPLWGVGFGTLLAWTIPGVILLGSIEGLSVRDSLAIIKRRPTTLLPIALTAIGMGVLGGLGAGIGYYIGLTLDSGLYFVLSGLCVAVLMMTIPFGVALKITLRTIRDATQHSDPSHEGNANANRENRDGRSTLLLLGGVLFLLLSVGMIAGGARYAELRPSEPIESLDGSNDQQYETALSNTLQQDHAIKWIVAPGTENESTVYEWRYDHDDRQAMLDDHIYFSTGSATANINRSWSTHLYWEPFLREVVGSEQTRSGKTVQLPGTHPGLTIGIRDIDTLPATNRSIAWERVETNEKIQFETTDPEAVQPIAIGYEIDIVETEDALLRATIDPDTKTVTRFEARYNGTLREHGETSDSSMHWAYEISTEVAVTRPDSLGSPSLEERIWKTLIY